MPNIIVDGVLREGNTVELIADFTGDMLSFLHTNKRWTVFAEKNIRYHASIDEYYYNENEGVVYSATDSDNVRVDNLVTGRLFALFTYYDYITKLKVTVKKVFTVLPLSSITIPSNIIKGDTVDFEATTTVNNTSFTWTFTDSVSALSGAVASKECLFDGYFYVDALFDYSNATYVDGDGIVWDSLPETTLAKISLGAFGNGTPSDINGNSLVSAAISASVTENISGQYLTKMDLFDVITMNVQYGENIDNSTTAPLNVFFRDLSTYSITTDTSASDRIEYFLLTYGDGNSKKFTTLNFETQKLYERSGTFNGSFAVYTAHTRAGGEDYRQSLSTEFSITINPFFSKWFQDHFPGNLYNSTGFNDLALAWGMQMDRLYNETQVLIDSIDIEKIDDRFLQHVAATYGDFPEIYEKVGFAGFVDGLDDKFKYFLEYNIFDKIVKGQLKDKEKQEFVEYIKSAKERLRLKGTPISIEKAVAQFLLTAKVAELWTVSFTPQDYLVIRDEVFSGESENPQSGLNYTAVSAPFSDNINQIIVNSSKNSYIEINTINLNTISYYTDTTETTISGGVEYVVFPRML
jgi:hypothetical protein